MFQVNRRVYFRDRYAFDEVRELINIATDFIPSLYAGKGYPYFIEGEFYDKISSVFQANCRKYIV